MNHSARDTFFRGKVISDDPTGKSHPVALARLVDYLLAALDDPVVCQSPRLVEITEMIAASLLDSSSRNLSWEQSLAPIIDEGSRAQSARHNSRRKKVQPREAFKKWLEENPQTVVVHIDELRSLPGSGLPPAVFEYVMKSTNRALREAYNEVRPGTLRPGR